MEQDARPSTNYDSKIFPPELGRSPYTWSYKNDRNVSGFTFPFEI